MRGTDKWLGELFSYMDLEQRVVSANRKLYRRADQLELFVIQVPVKKEPCMNDIDKERVVTLLNRILEEELAGVVRYTHYSFLVFGYGRIPIVSWLRSQADESLLHAQEAGEMITLLGAHPSLKIGLYRDLLKAVDGRSVTFEEYARKMIYAEEVHASEVDKMLRKPGEIAAFEETEMA